MDSSIKKPRPSLLPFPERLLERLVHTCCSTLSPPFSLEATPLGLPSPPKQLSQGHNNPWSRPILIPWQPSAQFTTPAFSKYSLLLASVTSSHGLHPPALAQFHWPFLLRLLIWPMPLLDQAFPTMPQGDPAHSLGFGFFHFSVARDSQIAAVT